MTHTYRDLCQQITTVIDAAGPDHLDYNVKGIADHIQREFGTVDVDTIDPGRFWEIVAAYDVS